MNKESTPQPSPDKEQVSKPLEESGKPNETILAPDQIEKYQQDLADRVAKAKESEEALIGKNVAEIKWLQESDAANDELLSKARAGLDYFETMDKLGELKDVDDQKKLEDLRSTVSGIEKNGKHIADRVEALYTSPQVKKRLEAEAADKLKVAAVQEVERKTLDDLDPETELIVKQVYALAGERRKLFQTPGSPDDAPKTLRYLSDTIEVSIRRFDQQDKAALQELTDGLIADIQTHIQDPEKIINDWQEKRKKLHFWEGKKKAILDHVIELAKPRIETAQRDVAQSKTKETAQKSYDKTFNKLSEDLKNVMVRAWEGQEKIDALVQSDGIDTNRLPYKVYKSVEDKLIAMVEEKKPLYYGQGYAGYVETDQWRLMDELGRRASGSGLYSDLYKKKPV